ncbi:integrase [Streptacidiphilus sp. PB12-B1b]|uniref:integrase n=1 Tax=Streptacidiphilus sp. PB12-B1b TaxID=2705012 RepID=UPI0015F9FD31|nr:integrase [Streptacidiphilus sp. PB12-B1b]QMU79763.1 integrase [Streptacidiphilus sp. PB12-B1b]
MASEAGSGRANEDFAAVGPGVAVVVDGAGTPDGLPTGCVHGTAWYARQLAVALHARATAGSEAGSTARGVAGGGQGLDGCLADAVEEVAAMHGGGCDLGDPMTPSATVAAVRFREDGAGLLEWLVLADATVVLDLAGPRPGQDSGQRPGPRPGPGQGAEPGGPVVVSDHRVQQVVRDQRLRLADELAGLDRTRRLHALVRAQRSAMNVQGGYWVAAADPKAAAEALTGSVPLARVRTAALLSDGAARAVDDFGVLDWPGLLALLAAQGPEGLIARTRELERGDPDGRRWPRGKRHDDATAVVLRSRGR